MNKVTGIGVIIAVIVGIIIVVAGISMNSLTEDQVPVLEENISENIILEESLPIEGETQEAENEGRNLSVELSETMNLKGP